MTWANSSVTVTMMLQSKFEVNLPSSFREEDDCWRMATNARASPFYTNSSPWAFGSGELMIYASLSLPPHMQWNECWLDFQTISIAPFNRKSQLIKSPFKTVYNTACLKCCFISNNHDVYIVLYIHWTKVLTDHPEFSLIYEKE
jgi:hypothetical protein